MPDVHAEILVGIHFVALADDEAAKRPVAVADRKLAATGILELIEATDGDFLFAHFGLTSASCRRDTTIASRMAGIPSAAA